MHLWLMVTLCFRANAFAVICCVVCSGLLVFLYARKTHTHDNVLNRQEMVLISLLLVAAIPATWILVG